MKLLNEIPSIEVLKSGTFDEEITVTNIFATIRLKNGGILTFQGLGTESFSETERLIVSRIGKWGIRSASYSDSSDLRGGNAGIDLCSEAIIAGQKPKYKIKNVSEAINQYNKILAFVESIPNFENKQFENRPCDQKWDSKESKCVTWKFQTDYLGDATGWENGQIESVCIKELGDYSKFEWCKRNKE